MDCKVCEGAGKQTVKVSGHVKPAEFTMPCVWCEGTGQMTEEQEAGHDAYVNMWCKCGNPSGEATFHDDTPEKKHHWRCDDCGKVTQVG